MREAYQRIADALRKNIENGKYSPREKLPSVRELCATYRVSVNTAVKAYDVLKSEHLVYAVPRSGCYILENRFRFVNSAAQKVIDFSRGNPLLDTVYMPDLKHCLDRAVELCNANSADWHELYGAPSLRRLLPKYLAEFRVFAAVENIFVNLGVQQALHILNGMHFPNGKDTILIEQPTYRYYSKFLQSSGAQVLGIPRGRDGIDMMRLESLFKRERIKFFYTVPNSHNPLGTCYSKEQRKEIARLAEKYDVYIVEDDYFGDVTLCDYGDPIYSYGDYRHHIYLKSFIKIIPWIRAGIAVIPAHLLPVFTSHAEHNSYFSPSLVSQATLEIYIRSNLLGKHVSAIKKELSLRLTRLRSYFAEASDYGAEWVGGESGFYCYLQLPDSINENQFVENLSKKGILVAPGSECFLSSGCYKKGVRISVARTTVDDIDEGIPAIYRAIKSL